VVPASAYGGLGHVAQWLPSGALGEAMRDAFLDGAVAWRDLAVLLAWAVAGTAATARTFSWE
jgi:ABC-2 type transport system permease protein